MNHLFSFRGRVNRAKLWLFALISFGISAVYDVILFFAVIVFLGSGAQPYGLMITGGILLLLGLLGYVLQALFLVAMFALATKRLHRGKSAVWLIPLVLVPLALDFYFVESFLDKYAFGDTADALSDRMLTACGLVAFALSLWAFVELYCLRGTVGDNRYGPDPLADTP